MYDPEKVGESVCEGRSLKPYLVLAVKRTTWIRWYLVSIQYVALCGAFTTQPPSIWGGGGFNPFFGISWWNQPNSDSTVKQVAQGQGTNRGVANVNEPSNLLVEPVAIPATKQLSYETATPVKVTKPVGSRGPTEPVISLRDLVRLAVGGMGLGQEVQGSSGVFSNIFSGLSRDSTATSSDSNIKSKTSETTTTKSIQKLATTSPATKVAVAPATQSKVVPTAKTKIAPTTTTTTTTTPKPTTTTNPTTTTTTTTPKPTTTTTTTTPKPITTTTPKPTTTTTTTPKPTTVAPVVLTTNKPIVEMTIGELLRLQTNLNAEANQVTIKAKGRPRGCHYNGTFYQPLSEIVKDKTGNWCYGSYCNHEGVVVHWDDHQCTTTQTAPPTTKPAETVPPVTQPTITNPPQPDGMANFMNMARMAGMGMADISRMSAMMGGTADTGGTGGTAASSIGSGNTGLGCFHNGQWYAPGAYIENLRNFGLCYGSFCNYNSEIVHWNDRCTAIIPTPTTGPGMGYMVQMGMGGQRGMAMSQMGMGGGEIGMDMSQMAALSGEGGLGMGGGGMSGETSMGGQAGMGTQSKGGLSMRQLRQLDII